MFHIMSKLFMHVIEYPSTVVFGASLLAFKIIAWGIFFIYYKTEENILFSQIISTINTPFTFRILLTN